MSNLPTFVYVVGPTACGKTELSIRLAQALQWPVINCDAVQVYKHVDIGTAKPSVEEMSGVPHYLFDYVAPPQKLTAAQYLQDVVQCLQDHQISNAIFVGGSGFYIQALEKGLFPEVTVSEGLKQEINQWVERESWAKLFDWISERDPEFAAKISPNDHYRIRRAVEVMQSQEHTMTQLKQRMATENHSPLPAHRAIKIGLNDQRSQLRQRVSLRSQKMLQQGLVDEVQSLLEAGQEDWSPLSSVGYKEVVAHLKGELDEGTALDELITTATMQLIKKQQTWFQRDSEIQWFLPSEQDQAFEWGLLKTQPND